MPTSAAVRRGNEKYNKREDHKRGKPTKSKAIKDKSPISTQWLSMFQYIYS